jgi:siroheme synthase
VSLGATVVIYMPGHDYSNIAHKLRSAGLSDETPCAIISRATTSEEQVFATNVGNLADAPRLPAPALLLFGEVLRHAGHRYLPEELGWPAIGPSFASHSETELSRSSHAGRGDEEQGA